MPYTWVNGDVITSARLNAIEQDRAPVTVQSITGQTNGNLTNYPVVTTRMAAANIGDFVYLFGGYNTSDVLQTTVYRYTISTNTFTAMASLATARQYRAAAVGSDVYLFATGATAETIRYNVAANTYTARTAYSSTGCLSLVSIGTYVYFLQSGTALIRYDTVADSYAAMAAIPVSSFYRLATDGTDIYLFGANNSYLYSVSGNTYTAKAALGAAYSTTVEGHTQGALYVGPSGSTRNKNKIWIQASQTGVFASLHRIYDIAGNSWTGAAATALSFETFCAIPASETIIRFNANTSAAFPWSYDGLCRRYTSYLSPFTASSQGIAVVYPTGQSIRNETTTVNGSLVSFKTGEVVTNNASRGDAWGGSAVAAFDAIVIQKG